MTINWKKECDYNVKQKKLFHSEVKKRLKKLASLLGLIKEDFDIRSNMGGIAVSGEVILHHEKVYIQVSQNSLFPSGSILIRKCDGKKDYTGKQNNFASIYLLDDLPKLAKNVQVVMQ